MAVLKKFSKKRTATDSVNQERGENAKNGTTDFNDKQARMNNLSPKQYEEFLLLLEGYSLKNVAQKMNIKYSTANTHMTNLYKKLGVNTRAELIIQYRNLKFKNEGE